MLRPFIVVASLAVERRRALSAQSSVAMALGLDSHGSLALELGLCGCGAGGSLLHSMWNLHGPGTEPMSPALAGIFSPTVPPGKSPGGYF